MWYIYIVSVFGKKKKNVTVKHFLLLSKAEVFQCRIRVEISRDYKRKQWRLE